MGWKSWTAIAVAIVAIIVTIGVIRHRERAAADQAFVYALPLVLTDLTREQTFAHPAAVHATPNRFYDIPVLADASFRTVIRPNVDTIYSIAWLDLRAQPVVLTIPENDGRYYVVQMMDAWTNVIAAPGTRTLGKAGARYLITGPGWHGTVPEGMKRIAAPTNMVWVLPRIYVRDPADLHGGQVLQHRIDARPLDRLNDANWQPALPDIRGRYAKRTDTIDLARRMDARTFYTRFLALTRDNPPAPEDRPFIDRVLAPLGISPYHPTPWEQIPASARESLERGMHHTWDVLQDRATVERQRTPTGWAGFAASKKIGAYGTNYPVRAAVAVFGLAANLPVDAVYLNATVDGSGNDLLGGKAYTLRFAPGELPPVKGFWSVTLYDRKGYLIPNPVNRYGIKQSDPLVYESDGSLVIHIQPTPPAGVPAGNWLPSPATDKFVLSLRNYWPEKRLLDGKWMPPAAVRVR